MLTKGDVLKKDENLDIVMSVLIDISLKASNLDL